MSRDIQSPSRNLSGSIDRDEVTLKLELQIQVHPEKEWVTIPMSFGDVFVKRFDHKSDAPDSKAVPRFGEQNSRQLHLFGAGLHTVTLEMMGKARSPAPGVRQLSLTLLSATASHADFRFATSVELQTLPVGSVDKPVRDDKGVRSVEFWGLSQTFQSRVVGRCAARGAEARHSGSESHEAGSDNHSREPDGDAAITGQWRSNQRAACHLSGRISTAGGRCSKLERDLNSQQF